MSYYLQWKAKEVVISYSDHDRRKVLDLIRSIKRENTDVIRRQRSLSGIYGRKRTKKIHGDLAEVGVYKGGSGKLICKTNTEKVLHLFDTFEGIPKVDEIDKSLFYAGQFRHHSKRLNIFKRIQKCTIL